MLLLSSPAQVNGERRPIPEPPRDRIEVGVQVLSSGGRQVRRIIISMPAPPAPADEEEDQRPARPALHFNLNSAVLEPENFDRWLFDDDRDQGDRQRHLDGILRAKVAATAREHRLTDVQRAKLRLAGSGDIKRFFDVVRDRRRSFETDRQSFRTGRAALNRLESLTQLYQEGPFGDGSLFAKTLRKINDEHEVGH